jgi:hypothetical protein
LSKEKILFFRLTAGLKKRKEKEKKRAKEQECKGLLSPHRTTTHNPKTNMVVVGVETVEVAKSRTAICRIEFQRTTAQQLYTTSPCQGTTICRRVIVTIYIIILTPFPHITVHIIQTKSVRGKRTYICGLLTILAFWFRSIGGITLIVYQISS